MKFKFKHQKFQKDAAMAVVNVFRGQPNMSSEYLFDIGTAKDTAPMLKGYERFTAWGNEKIVPSLSDDIILENIQRIQKENVITPSPKLEGRYNLTIEMETGVGKTYTYIKTMYELNRHYGWSKFIVVVPSVAIREGVYKSFQMTEEHFAEEYGKKIRYFIYNSARLEAIDHFAKDCSINVMIINSQAFNARGKDARRIHRPLDDFQSRRPIDVIAKTNPILIIDEPQSVEGKKTKENLKKFNPLMTLRYSATHRKDCIYNMVYRLDAMDAYNKKLVKKIVVKGIKEVGSGDSDGYVYLESINLSKKAPTATIQFNYKGKNGVRKVSRIVSEGYNLYDNSNGLEEYKDGYTVSKIDGRDNSCEFINGVKIFAGDVIGKVSEDELRRIQIRETIISHIERERQLYKKGIKVLSLFFIDEVAKYKQYDESGNPQNGVYADIFEEEYKDVLSHYQIEPEEDSYMDYLNKIPADKTHAGYFSIDKKGKMIDSKVKRSETSSDDVDAYDLIMRNKELLLDRDPEKSPVRFIFSHSALREGWDNPNVFQICTLKQSSSDVRKRQEIGRGLRLAVNNEGERMDENVLGKEVQDVNVLTVCASESYESFTKALQTEMAEAITDRPRAVNEELFLNKKIRNDKGEEMIIDKETAHAIYFDMIRNQYIDKDGALTEVYRIAKDEGPLKVAEEVSEYKSDVCRIIDSVYDSSKLIPENGRGNNVELEVDRDKLAMPEFKALWERINSKSYYIVDFDTDELVEKCIESLNKNLNVSRLFFRVDVGELKEIKSKDELILGSAFSNESNKTYGAEMRMSANIKYDLIGKIVEETGLTRKAVCEILQGIRPDIFNLFKENPEEFIIKASRLINNEKATEIIQHITYDILDDKYDTDIFTEPTVRGKLGQNAMRVKKHIYNNLVYDSEVEHQFAENLDKSKDVAVYAKLPRGFFISTPFGNYNPDWAIAFYEGEIKHIYFVAETKGTMDSMNLKQIETDKINCAKAHFEAISNGEVVYKVVNDYDELINLVRG